MSAQPLPDLRTLRELVDANQDKDRELGGEFPVVVDGELCRLVGAGELTAVVAPSDGGWEGRRSVRLDRIYADPADVAWRSKSAASWRTGFHAVLDDETRAARARYLSEIEGTPAAATKKGGRRGGATNMTERKCEHPDCDVRLRSNNESGRCRKHKHYRAADPNRERCSRPDCENVLHPANKSGICGSCQVKCPTCGRLKERAAPACTSCQKAAKALAEPTPALPPTPIPTAEPEPERRLCDRCDAELSRGTKGGRCLVCRRKCECGRPKGEDSAYCTACTHRLRRYRPLNVRASTPSRDELLAAMPATRPTAPATALRAGPAVPETPAGPQRPPRAPQPDVPTLEGLPEYVGELLAQVDRLREELVDAGHLRRRCEALDRELGAAVAENRRLRGELDQLRRESAEFRDVVERIQSTIGARKRT